MSLESIIIQRPQGPVSRLVLLTHGVGSEPHSMLGIGQWFAQREPSAFIVSVASRQPSDISPGLQWFSVRGVTEENRQVRVDAAMPSFVATIQQWQQAAGVGAERTTLIGFSQGAIMALESTKLAESPAREVIALAGRFASLPSRASGTAVHLLHGNADAVMPAALAETAYDQLSALGTPVTLSVVPNIGHMPHPTLLEQWALKPSIADRW